MFYVERRYVQPPQETFKGTYDWKRVNQYEDEDDAEDCVLRYKTKFQAMLAKKQWELGPIFLDNYPSFEYRITK